MRMPYTLRILAALLYVGLAVPPGRPAVSAGTSGQAEAAEVAGLVLKSDRVRMVDVTPRPLRISQQTLAQPTSLIQTENPRLQAALSVDPGTLELSLSVMDAQGSDIARFQPASRWIVIPRNRDVLWIVGKRYGEGFAPADGRAPYAGLYLHDQTGQRLATVDAETTGGIGRVEAEAGGGVVCLTEKGLVSIAANGEVRWIRASQAHELYVSRDGAWVGTDSWNAADDTRSVRLYDADGRLVESFSDTNYSHISLAAISADNRYLTLRKLVQSDPIRWQLSIRSREDLRTPIKTLLLDGGPERVHLSDRAEFLVVAVNEKQGATFRQTIKGLDATGRELFAFDPPEANVRDYLIDIQDRVIKLSGRDAVLRLEVLE